MPKGKGTYGSKVGRPPKNNKGTKMAKGAYKRSAETQEVIDKIKLQKLSQVKSSDYKEPWMKSLIKEFGLEDGMKAISEVLGTTYRDPKTGMSKAKGGLAMKNGGVKIRGTNVTKPATTKQYQNNLRGAGTSKTNKGKTKAPASYRRGGSARGK